MFYQIIIYLVYASFYECKNGPNVKQFIKLIKFPEALTRALLGGGGV